MVHANGSAVTSYLAVSISLLLCGPVSAKSSQSREQNSRVAITMTGTVVIARGRDFVFRGNTGYTYRCRILSIIPATLSVGDRIRAYGLWRDGALQATNIRVLREGTPAEAPLYGHMARVLTGEVVRSGADQEFIVLVADGWTYPVRAMRGKPVKLRVGQKVRVSGEWREGELQASNILIYGASNRSATKKPARPSVRNVTRTGVIVMDMPGSTFRLRTARGAYFEIRALAGQSPTLRAGDRARVFGDLVDGVLLARNIRKLS